MNTIKKIPVLLSITCLPTLLQAQTGSLSKKELTYTFPVLQNKAITGSPILGQPVMVQGGSGPVKALGMGWCDPVLYDWNQDGKKDLLIGEFRTGTENLEENISHLDRESNIRVYLNIGTRTEPKFSDQFDYAKDKTGARLNVVTECCIGFTPRFHDLNNDGFTDIITGSFLGQVTCYYGSKDGFEPPVDLEQKGFPAPGTKKLGLPITDPAGERYWSYSAADFADVDGDGLPDLITGGGALRFSRNIGTKTNPVFDKRDWLRDTRGDSLVICQYANQFFPLGLSSAVPLVTDWDRDGVPDLLVTNDYTNKKMPAVSFFRGVRQNKALRFEPPVSLFESPDTAKQFPGSWLRTWVADWNEDGINDLIIGASVPTVGKDEIDPLLSWEWESSIALFKSSPRYALHRYPEKLKEIHIITQIALRNGIITEEEKEAFNKRVVSMAHEGYVYVLLGQGTTPVVSQKAFTIQGRLTDPLYEGEKATLSYKKDDITETDTVRIKAGRFEFRGSISEPVEATLRVGYRESGEAGNSVSHTRRFYIDTPIIRIESRSLETADIRSGPTQRDFIELTDLLKPANEVRQKLMIDHVKAINNKDSLEMGKAKKLLAAADTIIDNLEFIFIRLHPDSYISLVTLHKNTYPVALAANKEKIANAAKSLSANLKTSKLYKEIGSRLEFAERLSVGKPAPDFTLNDTSGHPVSLSSFRGKYVLLDFWASWCLPCMFEMPHLAEAYKQYKDKGFDILGVSLDIPRFRQAWLNAINKKNLSWKNVSEPGGAKGAVTGLYGIYSIPMNYLIDPNGIIIATSLRGDELSRKLAEVFPDKKPAAVLPDDKQQLN